MNSGSVFVGDVFGIQGGFGGFGIGLPGFHFGDELFDGEEDFVAVGGVLEDVEFVDSLPRAPNGKVLKRLLREQHWTGGRRI